VIGVCCIGLFLFCGGFGIIQGFRGTQYTNYAKDKIANRQ